MKLFLLTQSVNVDYDTFDSVVVCAVDERDAKTIHPAGESEMNARERLETWAPVESVHVRYLGKAGNDIPRGVICCSFNAG